MAIAKELRALSRDAGALLLAVHVSGFSNTIADGLSRCGVSLFPKRILHAKIIRTIESKIGKLRGIVNARAAKKGVPSFTLPYVPSRRSHILWLASPQDFTSTVREFTTMTRPPGGPASCAILVPHHPSASWWQDLKDTRTLVSFPRGTIMWDTSDVPTSTSADTASEYPPLSIPARTSFEWVLLGWGTSR
jgi:hypothetical protein